MLLFIFFINNKVGFFSIKKNKKKKNVEFGWYGNIQLSPRPVSLRDLEEDIDLKFDVDSFVIVSNTLFFYIPSGVFNISLREFYAKPMDNKKVFYELEEIRKKKFGELYQAYNYKYYDFVLGTDHMHFHVIIRREIHDNYAPQPNLRGTFLDFVHAAVLSMPKNCDTYSTGGGSLAKGDRANLRIYQSDWLESNRCLIDQLKNQSKLSYNGIFFYVYKHGLIQDPSAFLTCLNAFDINEARIIIKQVHVGAVLCIRKKENDQKLLINYDKISTWFGIGNTGFYHYNPYFIHNFGYFSHVVSSSVFPFLTYAHAYTPCSHTFTSDRSLNHTFFSGV